jgi:acylphosphatase
MEKRVEIRIYGRVQGVFFRAYTEDVAGGLGVKGFVRNEPDGSVYVVAEGEEEKLKKLIEWCHKGPPGAMVRKVDVSWGTATGEFKNFTIKYF